MIPILLYLLACYDDPTPVESSTPEKSAETVSAAGVEVPAQAASGPVPAAAKAAPDGTTENAGPAGAAAKAAPDGTTENAGPAGAADKAAPAAATGKADPGDGNDNTVSGPVTGVGERSDQNVVDDGCFRVFNSRDAGASYELLALIKRDCEFEGVFVERWKMEIKWKAADGEIHSFLYADASCLDSPWFTHDGLGLEGSKAGRAACPETLAKIENLVSRGALSIPQEP